MEKESVFAKLNRKILMSPAVYIMLGFTVLSFICLVLFTFLGKNWLSMLSLALSAFAVLLLLGLTLAAIFSTISAKVHARKRPLAPFASDPLMLGFTSSPNDYNKLDTLAKESFDGNLSAAADYVLYSLFGSAQAEYLDNISAIQTSIMLESLSRRGDVNLRAKSALHTASNILILRKLDITEEEVLSSNDNPYKILFLKSLKRFGLTLLIISILVYIGAAMHLPYGTACVVSLIMAAPLTFSMVILFLSALDYYRFCRVKRWLIRMKESKSQILELCSKNIH